LTHSLLLMAGLAGTAGAAGLTLLVAPAAGRRLLRIADSAPATYALRIAGMMLFALGLFLGGFAAVGSLAEAA
jgi:uncharacterized protein YjeT (DUF2065 family)